MIDKTSIFNIQTEQEFAEKALDVFKYQFENNRVYRSFCDLLYKHPSDVKSITDIPFLPIEFFKTRKVLNENCKPQCVFTSSGTTGSETSKHYVTDLDIYEHSFLKGFNTFYGNVEDYTILALLPSYLEREGSSLLFMVNKRDRQGKI